MLLWAYLKPFFEAEKSGLEDFLSLTRTLLDSQGSDDPDYMIKDIPMNEEELEHFSSHLIYNFTPHAEWEDCIGQLGNFVAWRDTRTTRERDAG